jgi:hypothetical protein
MAPSTSDTPQARPVLRRVAYEPPAERFIEREPVAVPAVGSPAPAGAVPVEPVVDEATRVRLTRLVVVLLELLDGRRPAAAAAALGSPQVARYLTSSFSRRRVVSASRALSVRIYQPRPGSAEVAAVCVIDRAFRAVALRAERDEHPFDGHAWRVTALRVL